MAEYIKREELIIELNKIATEYLEDNSVQCSLAAGVVVDIKNNVVAKQPTADVVPVEWISVKDRLPETNGKYLVAYYSMQFKRYFLDLLYYDAQNKDEYFYCAENYKQKVDYWMPLPEPPKKEGADNDR